MSKDIHPLMEILFTISPISIYAMFITQLRCSQNEYKLKQFTEMFFYLHRVGTENFELCN